MAKRFLTFLTVSYMISCFFVPNIFAETSDGKSVDYRKNIPHNRALEDYNRAQNLNKTVQGDPALRAIKEFEHIQKLNNDANIVHYTSVLAKKPKDAATYAKRGKAYSANKLYDKALADYSKAIELDPKQADAYVGRAVCYLMNKDFDKCWNDVHKAESMGEKFWPAFMDSLKKESKREK
jgi:tetratricopeptide (TPR) repeat protein